MGVRSLVSIGLLLIPIAVTLGTLFGLDAYRSANGQKPLFSGDGGSGGGGSGGSGATPGGSGSGNTITIYQYCQKAFGITPKTKGQQFTFNPNQWGWTQGTPGGLCLNVSTFSNNTYGDANAAAPFSATWSYPQSADVNNSVHAFPNVLYDGEESGQLPTQISSLQNVNVGVQWTYGVGDTPAAATDQGALASATLNGNVAFDMFMDANKDNAQDATTAQYEVMVWLARFGSSTDPLGQGSGVMSSQVINGTTFNLYYGINSGGQHVSTWLASTTTETFYGDIGPLITSLSTLTNIQGPATTDYLGYVQFGSEAFYSTQNVTFNVPHFEIDVVH